jgi:hypothetical protein
MIVSRKNDEGPLRRTADLHAPEGEELVQAKSTTYRSPERNEIDHRARKPVEGVPAWFRRKRESAAREFTYRRCPHCRSIRQEISFFLRHGISRCDGCGHTAPHLDFVRAPAPVELKGGAA